jgi:hypothetical protein
MQTKDELFARWLELRKRPQATSHIFSDATRRALEELKLLEALRSTNCTHIPGEASDVDSLIKDRQHPLPEISNNLS